MGNGVFVTGTDTGVGKTVVSAALIRRLRQMHYSVGVMKPVETGASSDQLDSTDAGRLMTAAETGDELDLVSPYRFYSPLAPLAAARVENRRIEVSEVMCRFSRLNSKHSCVLVEGAGGVLVPMGEDWLLRDLIMRLKLPVLLVGRAGLGGVNHALLTLECLTRAGVTVMALVLNETTAATTAVEQSQVASTAALLRGHTDIPVLGPLPYQDRLGDEWSDTIEQLAGNPLIVNLAQQVRRATAETFGSPIPDLSP
jgi:dethiobiotin synthetase